MVKKLYTKKQVEEMAKDAYYCPLRCHRVQVELCAHLQSQKKNWKKCFALECDKLDSDYVLASLDPPEEE